MKLIKLIFVFSLFLCFFPNQNIKALGISPSMIKTVLPKNHIVEKTILISRVKNLESDLIINVFVDDDFIELEEKQIIVPKNKKQTRFKFKINTNSLLTKNYSSQIKFNPVLHVQNESNPINLLLILKVNFDVVDDLNLIFDAYEVSLLNKFIKIHKIKSKKFFPRGSYVQFKSNVENTRSEVIKNVLCDIEIFRGKKNILKTKRRIASQIVNDQIKTLKLHHYFETWGRYTIFFHNDYSKVKKVVYVYPQFSDLKNWFLNLFKKFS